VRVLVARAPNVLAPKCMHTSPSICYLTLMRRKLASVSTRGWTKGELWPTHPSESALRAGSRELASLTPACRDGARLRLISVR